MLSHAYLKLLQIFSAESRNVQLLPLRWLDLQPLSDSGALREGTPETCYGPRYIACNQIETSFQSPDIFFRVFENVRVSITSSSIITSDNIALVERTPIRDEKNTRFNYSAGQIVSHGKSLSLTLSTEARNITRGIFLGGNGSYNYYHWMVEILPRIQFLSLLPAKYSSFPLLVSEDVINIPTFRQTIERFAGKYAITVLEKSHIYEVEHLVYIDSPSIIPFNLHQGISYEQGFSFVSSKSIQYVRDVALQLPEPDIIQKPHQPKKVFFCRKEGTRNYNQEEVAQFLTELGFEKVYMEDLSFQQQVALASQADWIVGPTGAAWTNLIFCQTGARCLCWMSVELKNFSAYSSIAAIVGVDLLYIHYDSNVRSTSDLSTADYFIDLSLIEQGLNELENLAQP